MKIVIPGGSGQIGTILARHFHKQGHEVVVLSRKARKTPWRSILWDGETLGSWVSELEGADVLINLAGKSVNCRYTWKNRWLILESRTRSVRILGKALSSVTNAPAVWLQAATATIYAHRFDAPNDENQGLIGGVADPLPDTWRFSIDVARAWEGEFLQVDCPTTRKVALRSAMTMSPDVDGIFDYLLWLVRLGLGGSAGSGKQYVSWIHEIDFIRAIEFLIERNDIEGTVNVAAPHPLPNEQFMSELRDAWGKRWSLPVYEWMLELGARILQTESELVLKSRRVVPGRLQDSGFTFRYPHWRDAATHLCEAWKHKEPQAA